MRISNHFLFSEIIGFVYNNYIIGYNATIESMIKCELFIPMSILAIGTPNNYMNESPIIAPALILSAYDFIISITRL